MSIHTGWNNQQAQSLDIVIWHVHSLVVIHVFICLVSLMTCRKKGMLQTTRSILVHVIFRDYYFYRFDNFKRMVWKTTDNVIHNRCRSTRVDVVLIDIDQHESMLTRTLPVVFFYTIMHSFDHKTKQISLESRENPTKNVIQRLCTFRDTIRLFVSRSSSFPYMQSQALYDNRQCWTVTFVFIICL
jgi:hypothetical protein